MTQTFFLFYSSSPPTVTPFLHLPIPPPSPLLHHLPSYSFGSSSLCSKLQIQSEMDSAYFLEMLAGNFMDVVQYNEDNRAFEVRQSTHAKQYHYMIRHGSLRQILNSCYFLI